MKTNETIFCEECRKDVHCSIHTVPMTGKIKEKTYDYTGKEARCPNCSTLLYIPAINDFNLKALYDVYRKENGIISLRTVLSLPKKYGIGKRPLSRLLGWGEQTYSRYCEGDLPTRQYSEILTKIDAEPTYFLELLENGKTRLKSPMTYEKSKKTVLALLSHTKSEKSKIDTVTQYLLNQCQDITPLALQKTLYYIQGFFCAFNHSFLFAEDCQAWVHGPVYRDIYLQYKNYRFDPISQTKSFDDSVFSSEEKAIYDSVIQNICCYSGKTLEYFTHTEAPWLITRGDLPINEPSDRIIEKMLIKDYFENIKNKYHMVRAADIRNYTESMFQKWYASMQ